MESNVEARSILALAVVTAVVGCSSGNAFVTAGSTKSSATPSGTPTASSAPTPTAAPTPTPRGTGPVGSTTCTAPTELAGTYTFIDTTGVVTGSTYTEQSGDWGVFVYPSPTPTPTPSPVDAPTPEPSVVLPVPTPTGMVTEYYGTYMVPSYSGYTTYSGAYTTDATIGCFGLTLVQDVGGAAGQTRSHRASETPAPTPTPNANGYGAPTDPDENVAYIDNGSLTSLRITNLTPTSGSGTFSFIDSDGATVSGTLTITGSQTEDNITDFRRRMPAIKRQGS